MRFLASAQPCGFGPVSKLVALASFLEPSDICFAGGGVALEYARLHSQAFHRVAAVDTGDPGQVLPLLAEAEAAISVMDAELVYWAVRAGVPAYLFDSLLSFWRLDHPLEWLASVARLVRSAPEDRARRAFERLGPHERILVAHLLAERSYAQRFPGVDARVAQLRAAGAAGARACGPIVNLPALEAAMRARPDPSRPTDLLLNLGGFKNFLLDYDRYNAYLQLIRRWVGDLPRDWRRFRRITVCCGAFPRSETTAAGPAEIEATRLPHGDFLRRMVAAPVYLMPPSLTSLHEAVIAGILPMALPEQHYGHVFNLRMLAGTPFRERAATLFDLPIDLRIPEDDLEGTRAMAAATSRIVADPDDYRAFRGYMNERIDGYLAVGDGWRSRGVEQLRRLLQGPPLAAVMSDLAGAAP
jgi:hypothetical protein